MKLGMWGALCLAVVGTNAYADFNGHWEGQGQISTSDGSKETCTQMVIEVQQTADSLSADYTMTCGGSTFSWIDGAFEIKNGELWGNGVKVGDISEDSFFHYQIDFDENGSTYHSDLKVERNGDSIHYFEMISGPNGFSQQTEGVLSHQ